MGILHFTGYGGNVVGSLGSGSLIQDMPSAMQLNGTDAYASGSTNMSTVTGTTATVSMWVYYTGSQTNQGEKVLFSDSSSESRKILLQTRDYGSHGTSFRYGYVDSAGGGVAAKDTGGSAGVLTSGAWQHVALVADGTSVSLHIDGEQLSDATYSAAGTNSYAITNPHLGRAAFSDGRYFPGYIRDVQVYNVSSSDAQVVELMNGEFPHDTPIHWWTCDDGATNDDGSGTDSDLTLTNTVEDKAKYELNQIGVGSVSGSVTLSGGTWNLRDSTYLDFNGSSAYCNVPSAASLDEPKTIAFWCRPDAIQSGANNIVSRGANDYEIYFHSSTNTWWNYWGDKYSTGADGPPVGVGEWQHIVCTLDDTTSPPTVRWYKDGELYNTDPLSGTPAYGDDGVLNIGRDATEENDYFDGIIKDVMLYDSKLTDTQVELLFKGQWVGRPQHWWKLNEGTGNGEDSGQNSSTAQTNSTTWVKPDYDVVEGVTTIAGAVLSAPEGVLSMSAANWGAATFIHNSGTVTPTNAGTVEWEFSSDNAGSDNALYNLATNAAGQIRYTKGYIVENLHSNSGGNGFNYLVEDRQYNYGTTSSAASSSALLRSVIGTATDYAKIYGVSKLHPFKLGAWDDTPLNTEVALKNVNVTVDIPSGRFAPSGRTVRLDGDCEFEDVLVETDTKLDLNGQRVKFNGDFTVESAGHNNGGGLIFAEGDFSDGNGTGNSYTTKTLVMDAGYCNPAQTTWQQIFLRDGTQTIGGNRDWGGTPIIMGGTSNFTSNNTWGDITIPTLGTLDGNSVVVTAEGDFNMAGGIIGKSALLCSGAHWASGASVLNYSSTDVTGISIGAWIKGIDVANGDTNQMILRQNDNFISIQADGSIYVGVELQNASSGYNYPSVITADGTISDNKWHHIGMTWASGSTLKAYLDGKLIGENTTISTDYVRLRQRAAAQDMGVGAYQGNSEYEGIVGQACRWHTELSESDIRTHMFQDFSSLASTTNLIYWYQFDSANGTAILDSSTNDCDLTSVTVASNAAEAAWVGPGTYTYDTSTLKFDKAGTCNFTGHQDGNATQLHSIHITSGTTVAADCRDNDLVMNSGSLMTNSGTLTSNRNWQYKSRNMPIVGPNSDLKVSTNIWYYMSDGSGLPASGAGTDYYQLRPATNVYMQGDFDCQNGLLQSGGDLHLNGYACSTSKIWNYGGGNIHADPGSSIVFDNADGFNTSYGESPTTMFFVASGEAAYQAISQQNNHADDGVYTNTSVFGSGTSQMSVSYWLRLPSDSDFFDASVLRCIWGFGGIFTGTPTAASHAGAWAHTTQSSYLKNDLYTYDAPGTSDSEFNRVHETFVKPIDFTGTGPYGWHHICTTIASGSGADKMITYVDGVEVDKRTKNKDFLTVSSSYPGLSVHGAHTENSVAAYGTKMSIADFRVYSGTTLTSGNAVTLASENPATSVSGAYADSTNTLGATLWWKLNATNGVLDTTDSAGTNNGTAFGGAKTGFVNISSSATPYNPINNLYPAGVTLTNVYMSGSKDIVVGQRKENSAGFMAASSQTVITQGTVVMD